MLNGAQGDDDEAHAGHFALVTGRVQDDGAIGDWLVNNFYTLDTESEKGILAAPVPLDNYLADLNAGQAWYRPSYMLVAVLPPTARRRCCSRRSGASTTSSGGISSPITIRRELHEHQRRCAARARLGRPGARCPRAVSSRRSRFRGSC